MYIDKIEHIDAVKKQLKKMYGDNVEIYDNTSNYLDSECKVVGLMGKTSKIPKRYRTFYGTRKVKKMVYR